MVQLPLVSDEKAYSVGPVSLLLDGVLFTIDPMLLTQFRPLLGVIWLGNQGQWVRTCDWGVNCRNLFGDMVRSPSYYPLIEHCHSQVKKIIVPQHHIVRYILWYDLVRLAETGSLGFQLKAEDLELMILEKGSVGNFIETVNLLEQGFRVRPRS